ncbi:MAG: tagatose 1,6-diphosphate aldolase [Chloroflexota bacterium]
MRIATLRGLDACASDAGTFSVLALDHRNNLRRMLGKGDPDVVGYQQLVDTKRAIVRAVAGTASGVLLDPEVGAAQAIVDGSLPRGAGLIVAVEASGYLGPSEARVSRVLPGWSVAQIKRLGADAVKMLLYYHPDAANAADQERLLIRIAEDCADADIALFLEPLGFSIDESVPRLSGEARRDVVVRTARRLTALGSEVLKSEFPYDASVTDHARWAEACQELEEASSIPWVILSAGVDDDTFEAQTEIACKAGASGVLVGRSVWGDGATLPDAERDAWLANEGVARMQRLVDIVDRHGTAWRQRSPLSDQPEPGEDWYLDYGA